MFHVSRILGRGNDDDRQGRTQTAQLGKRLETVHPRHGDVQDNNVEVILLGDHRERLRGVAHLKNNRVGTKL